MSDIQKIIRVSAGDGTKRKVTMVTFKKKKNGEYRIDDFQIFGQVLRNRQHEVVSGIRPKKSLLAIGATR